LKAPKLRDFKAEVETGTDASWGGDLATDSKSVQKILFYSIPPLKNHRFWPNLTGPQSAEMWARGDPTDLDSGVRRRSLPTWFRSLDEQNEEKSGSAAPKDGRIRNLLRMRCLIANNQQGGLMSKLDQEKRDDFPARQFAFPKQRKEPLEDASHVRNAIARFRQVEGVTDQERDDAWTRIRAAARKFDVELSEGGWRDLEAGEHRKR
jgi:hypothetical protein